MHVLLMQRAMLITLINCWYIIYRHIRYGAALSSEIAWHGMQELKIGIFPQILKPI